MDAVNKVVTYPHVNTDTIKNTYNDGYNVGYNEGYNKAKQYLASTPKY